MCGGCLGEQSTALGGLNLHVAEVTECVKCVSLYILPLAAVAKLLISMKT